MEPSLDVAAWAFAAVAAQAAGTLALWLRLRGRERCEREHREHLLAAARELPPGSELRERFGDGASLVVRTDPGQGVRR